ncbi:thiol:disulfide interchange protein DsbA/DsbL [Psychrobium sp. 1_MG-2023]|uniref:thiol:disulfide interchange protein DsbA/DsbL n=1 Tax=Psychrobium sp. 1_MG-2023 TaxID=3062624 RepID=UPI000C32489C|nr:thiol:disulfide interchange protein DsbA/DsbL [Psychrobium sp. 1_MG-2023]MDP2561021.1 thiol:disulfide interchange protein DsbA/DsbL [Psychrobium sp. 1_MG-2023]PKF58314.1 thiol:disulfide interchange protein [Alteromonadales bacterium alter-6D02]
MKKIALVLFALLLSPLTLAADFVEGTHYTVVSKSSPTKSPEIVEFFSFLCPACYRFEPLVADLKKNIPSNVKFNKSHVDFLGGDTGKALSRAFAVASLLKVEDTINPAIFNAVHVQRRNYANLDQLRQLFIDNGVSAKKFDGAVKSFMINAKVSKMANNTQKFAINGVPTFIINGKYQINNKSIASAEMFQELVTYLTNKKG